MAKRAVLLLAHGTPETVEQIPEYLRNVVSGRPLPQAVVEEIQHRYALIGHSPLTEITMAQARLVEAELNGGGEASSAPQTSDKNKDVARMGHPSGERVPVAARMGHPLGERVPVYVGMRNWRPYIPEVVRQMRADGIEEAAVICMAPQNSRTSVGLYRRAVEAEAARTADRLYGRMGTASAAGRRVRGAAAAGAGQTECGDWRAGAGFVHGAQRADADGGGRSREWRGHFIPPWRQRQKCRDDRAPGLAGAGRRSLRRGGAAHGGTGGGASARRSAVVVCVPEPGRERRAVAGAERGGDAGPDCRPRA